MRKPILLVSFLLSLFSCQSPSGEKSLQTRLYYPLDSVLAVQKEHLVGKELTKTVVIGNQEEKASIHVTPAFLEKEWAFLNEFDLNKPGFVGAIDVIKTDSTLRYNPKADESLVISYLEFSFDPSHQLSGISGAYFDSNSDVIYVSFRDFNLVISDGWVSSYSINGYQKIIMKDTAFFEVSAYFN